MPQKRPGVTRSLCSFGEPFTQLGSKFSDLLQDLLGLFSVEAVLSFEKLFSKFLLQCFLGHGSIPVEVCPCSKQTRLGASLTYGECSCDKTQLGRQSCTRRA